MMINKYNKIVIKIGSSSIINSKTKKINSKWMASFCKDISKIYKNTKIVIVCSVAIALGSNLIKKNTHHETTRENWEKDLKFLFEEFYKDKHKYNWPKI